MALGYNGFSMNATQLLQQVKQSVREVSADELRALLDAKAAPTLIDVSENDEMAGGILPGAIAIARGFLELRIEDAVPDRNRPLVVYCAGGVRSAYAAQTLATLG